MLVQRALIAAAAALLVVAPASAQNAAPETPGGVIALFGGGATTTSTAGPLVGGTILFDINNRLSLEGQGAWFDRGSGAEAFTLGGSLLVNIVPLGRTAVPYAAVGGGLYRASFDLAHAQLLGAIEGRFGPGNAFCPTPGIGYMNGPGLGFGDCVAGTPVGFWGVGDMPRFYARRLGMMVVPPSGAWGTRTFTDPAVSFGGGVRIGVANHLEVRPDARAIVVLDGGNSHTVGVFGVNVGYRF